MVVQIENCKQVAYLYKETQLRTRPIERSKFVFSVKGNTMFLEPSYDLFKENFLDFVRKLGVSFYIKRYRA